MKKIDRREILFLIGGTALGSSLLGKSSPISANEMLSEPFKLAQKHSLWKPRELNLQKIIPTAYQGFYHNGYGCSFGVFYSIIGLMGEKFGKPYSDFPFTMMEVGKSGISNWGTICGALLGAASVLSMFWGREERDPLVDQLFRWYELTAFPMYKPTRKIVKFDGKLPTSVSNSPLCHVSVSRWAYSSGFPAKSEQRSERCARLTADVALKTWEIIDSKMNGRTVDWYSKSETRKYCGQCHDPGMESPIAKGKQDCGSCHSGSNASKTKFKNHP